MQIFCVKCEESEMQSRNLDVSSYWKSLLLRINVSKFKTNFLKLFNSVLLVVLYNLYDAMYHSTKHVSLPLCACLCDGPIEIDRVTWGNEMG